MCIGPFAPNQRSSTASTSFAQRGGEQARPLGTAPDRARPLGEAAIQVVADASRQQPQGGSLLGGAPAPQQRRQGARSPSLLAR